MPAAAPLDVAQVLIGPVRAIGKRFAGLEQIPDRLTRFGGQVTLGQQGDDPMSQRPPRPGSRCKVEDEQQNQYRCYCQAASRSYQALTGHRLLQERFSSIF